MTARAPSPYAAALAPNRQRGTDTAPLRRAVAAMTVLSCLPYLTLKVAWIAGSTIGGAPTVMRTPAYVVANVITAALDLVLILLALAYVCRWGRAVPSWALVSVTWIGTGLLAPVALGAPLGMVVEAILGGAEARTVEPEPLEPWVFRLVYGGFAAQAVLLVLGFAGCVRDRWPHLQRPGPGTEPYATLRRFLAVTGAAAALGYAGCSLAWAPNLGPFGGDPAAVETPAQQTVVVVRGLIVAAAAVAGLRLAFTTSRSWAVVATAWIGSATTLVAALVGVPGTAAGGAIAATTALSGLALGVSGLLCLDPAEPPDAPRTDLEQVPSM